MAYEPTKWWRVVDGRTGDLWCETSSEKEARESMRKGDFLQRCYQEVVYEWRNEK